MMMLAILVILAAGQVRFEAASDSSPSERAPETEVFPNEGDSSEASYVRDARQRFHSAALRQPPVTVAQFIPMLVAMQSSTNDTLDVPEGLNARVEQEASILLGELADCQSAGGAELDAMTQVQRLVQQRLVSAAWIPIARMLITLGQQPETAVDLSIVVDDVEDRYFGDRGAASASGASSSAFAPIGGSTAGSPRVPRRGNRKGGVMPWNACLFAGVDAQDGRRAGLHSSSSGWNRLSYPSSFLQRVLRTRGWCSRLPQRRSRRSSGSRRCRFRQKYGGLARPFGIFFWMLHPLVFLLALVKLASMAQRTAFLAQFVPHYMPVFFFTFALTTYTRRRQYHSHADPGPTSGRCTVHFFGRFHLMLIILFSTLLQGTASAGVPEPRVADVAKSAESTGPLLTVRPGGQARLAKRSLRRAVRRAGTWGGTWYKGRWLTVDRSRMVSRDSLDCTGSPGVSSSRKPWLSTTGALTLTTVTWNCGGLSNAVLEEFLMFVDAGPASCRPHVLLIQETHWSFDSEWQRQDWYCVHSGRTQADKYGGVLVMVRLPQLRREHIRARHVVQGRLLHVRIDFSTRNLDLFNFYQQSISFTQSQEHYTRRAMLFRKLDAALSALPVRNLLILGGDFNLQASCSPPHVGPRTTLQQGSEQVARDLPSFMDCLRKYDLCVLNTWGGRQPYTYVHLEARTQIDFILTRLGDAIGPSKTSAIMPGLHLTGWKDTRHFPVRARVPFRPSPWRPSANRQAYNIAALKASLQSDAATYQSSVEAVRVALSGSSLADYGALQDSLRQVGRELYPMVRRSRGDSFSSLRGLISKMWHHYQWSRGRRQGQCSGATFREIFTRWRHLRQFQHMRRLTQQHGRMLKRARLEGYLQQAENAATQGNQHALYGIIRRLAPKAPYRRVQVRGDHDEIIDSPQECEIIRRHYTGVWGVQAPAHCRLLSPCHSRASADLPPFTYEDIKFHVDKIRVHKAVPTGVPHPGLWRLASPTLSFQLLAHCQAHWHSPSTLFLPAWHQTWVVLIPKPGKPSGRIQSMRPIALQDPLGKAFVSLLAVHFRQHALQFLRGVHQYAYVPHRDVLGCLVRAMDHCRLARRLLRAQTYNLHSLRQGGSKRPHVAALQVSIDLSQAFDRAPWDLLREALRRTSAPLNLQEYIMSWVQQTQYNIMHHGSVVQIRAKRGVRQGCVLSPTLWSVFTGLIAMEYELRLGSSSVRPQLSQFADDIHICWILYSVAELNVALRQLRTLFRLLESFGLQVNPDKSQAMFTVAGSFAEATRKRLILSRQGRRFLFVPDVTAPLHIPLYDRLEYMGVVLSYSSLEEQTMTKRLGVAQGSFDRLRRFLNTRRVLGLRHRLQLWQATVLPAMTYGVLAAGVTKHSLDRFHGMYMRHVRAISNSPVHVTNESNMELLRRLGFPAPVDHLLNLVVGRMRGLERLGLLLPCDDVMMAPSLWQWLVDLRGNLSCFSHFYKRDAAGIVPVVDAPFLCNICGRSFSTQASLRLHDSKVHTKVRKKPVPSLKNLGDRIREHGVDGMPTCKYCLHPFPRWNGLTRHLQLGRCEAYLSRVAAGPDAPALQATVPPLIEHPTFFDDFARRGTQALSQHPAVLAEAASHCCLCRQWFSSPSAYKTHLRRVHVEAWQRSGERSIQRVTAQSLSGPCPYCKATVSAKTKHKCPVLGHLYFAALHHGGRGRAYGTHGDGASNVRASSPANDPKEDSFCAGGESGLGSGCAGVQVPSNRGGQGQASQGLAQGSRQGQGASLARGIQRWFTKAIGSPAADGQHVGAPGPETRGRACDSKGQLGVCLIASHGPGDGEHARPVVPGQPAVEETEGAGQGDFSSSRHSLGSAAGGVGQSGEFAAAEPPGHAERNSGGLDRARRRPNVLELLGVGCSSQAGDQGYHHPTYDARSLGAQDQDLAGGRQGGHYPSVSWSAPSDGGPSEGEIYTMLLEVGTNGEREQNVHAFLRDLCNLSVWRLLAGRFRRDRLQRTPLANRLSESLQ